MPPRFAGTEAPSFAAILTMRTAAGMLGKRDDASLARAEPALRNLPVADAERIARCARYDNEVPEFSLPAGKPRIPIFEKMTGFRDGPSVEAAHAAFIAMAKRNGWAMISTEDEVLHIVGFCDA